MTDDTWTTVLDGVKRDVGANSFSTWIAPLRYRGLEGGILSLGAPTDFMGKWVVRNYSDVLLRHVAASGASASRVICHVGETGDADPAGMAAAAAPVAGAAASTAKGGVDGRLDRRFTFDSFVVGQSNELAHAAAKRVASPGPVAFNPLFLYSGVGLGKTHLMQAIAHEISETQPNRKVLYLSAEQFMYRFVTALRTQSTMDFKHLFRTVDILLVDDVQFIAGKDSTQDEFFHTFNALVDAGKQVVISADRSPNEISDLEERIRTRLQAGLVVDLHPADYELRLGVLQQRVEALQEANPDFTLSHGVLEWMAGRITQSIRVLEGAVTRLFAHADLVKREVTLEQAQEALVDLIRAQERKLTIEQIMRTTCEHYNLRMNDMTSARRSRSIARPRQLAMYLAKKLTPRSYPEIGRRFGGKDHTTVLYAVKRIEELMQTDPQLREDAQVLQRRLEG
ncbi:chromosomal replication initiator protein DnaA [Jannaschia sp. Os4]|uniref:chromosomal replication initiator protein DnaA n=1 Tax=Jannaschia sp. Os4 TaxID=2807617 RepID=UPI001EEE9720|nr:chromosomal replication initiator protein DnaA [Jannaschia sp. Os4]